MYVQNTLFFWGGGGYLRGLLIYSIQWGKKETVQVLSVLET